MRSWVDLTLAEKWVLSHHAKEAIPSLVTMESRNRDALDFYDVGVLSLRDLLARAFEEGKLAGYLARVTKIGAEPAIPAVAIERVRDPLATILGRLDLIQARVNAEEFVLNDDEDLRAAREAAEQLKRLCDEEEADSKKERS